MDERDREDLARLHVACLSDSTIGALGVGYVEAFYRYVTRSDKEIAIVERNRAGRIVAATVITLEPTSLNRRLVLHTPLLLRAVLRAPRLLALLWPGRRSADTLESNPTKVPDTMPEMILLFTSPEERRNGLGSALIERAEHRLRQLHVAEYQVRTVLDAANPALAFYGARKFTPAGTAFRLGKLFQVFTRRLDAPKGSPAVGALLHER